ncbi:AAA family ATPase [Amnibacterium setariae]|uniref:ATP-binding cassette domain-containing protein n=1 Tax=Amnibacterium setariae TaxID=2306585 RepID=A0A3A1TXM7_9MICO|nr:AAA family ATPase [Amnibacterium setariae]RIX28321.1 ATP-binding cassette domain-containing protein [Amnibacterium setariae]
MTAFLRFPVRRVEANAVPIDRRAWPATIPAVQQLLSEGLDLGRATVLVGENGAGKSTLVEAVAIAYGLSPEGGSPNTLHATRPSESQLHEHLTLVRNGGSGRFGYFLRAETMHGVFTYLEQVGSSPYGPPDPRFHEISHGESFLALLRSRFAGTGLWVLDEPESALSFSGCMALLAHLVDLLEDDRNQVLLSTHSPLLAGLPGADVLEVGEHGLRRTRWEDTDLVQQWRAFLAAPRAFLRHL